VGCRPRGPQRSRLHYPRRVLRWDHPRNQALDPVASPRVRHRLCLLAFRRVSLLLSRASRLRQRPPCTHPHHRLINPVRIPAHNQAIGRQCGQVGRPVRNRVRCHRWCPQWRRPPSLPDGRLHNPLEVRQANPAARHRRDQVRSRLLFRVVNRVLALAANHQCSPQVNRLGHP
jgi:hypothetical protein